MNNLVINQPINKTMWAKIGLFSIPGFEADIYYADEMTILEASAFLYFGANNGRNVIVVSDDFLALEQKEHDVAETMCLHEAGHRLTNSLSQGASNIQHEMNADKFAYDNNGKDKLLLHKMYLAIEDEYKKFGVDKEYLAQVQSQLKQREQYINSL